jgi:hypothetical protein
MGSNGGKGGKGGVDDSKIRKAEEDKAKLLSMLREVQTGIRQVSQRV